MAGLKTGGRGHKAYCRVNGVEMRVGGVEGQYGNEERVSGAIDANWFRQKSESLYGSTTGNHKQRRGRYGHNCRSIWDADRMARGGQTPSRLNQRESGGVVRRRVNVNASGIRWNGGQVWKGVVWRSEL